MRVPAAGVEETEAKLILRNEPRPPDLTVKLVELVVPWLPFRFAGMYLALPWLGLILYRGMPSAYVRIHEITHHLQRESMPHFRARYLIELLQRGYHDNWFEVQARNAQESAWKELPEWYA